ncbi:MAG: hypothetical protein KJ904_18585 [Alphaproteobacteria bacterium]|nr:hypothetical protein [Alphaproteobacteria bacterium]MBU0796315.1 hypothetical protein [Alphaproteobacteria bacterium]MBU0889168.1 hypothetical protein [Alphaproteobacteria bacterium]MBU1812202.1 hypothetical protein [Alphaproteobacteria bacterium]
MEHGAAGGLAFLHPLLAWLEGGALGRAMRQEAFLFPAVEIIHILGFALLIGAIAVLDLRLLGWRSTLLPPAVLPAGLLARLVLPVSITGLLLAIPSGLMLLATEATSIGVNTAFLVKLGLLALALLNILLLHRGIWRHIAEWESAAPPARVRVAALASLLLWVGILIAGRMIAYV